MAKNELILASASPRRAELLKQAGYRFMVQAGNLEKEEIKPPLPRGVELLALEKARSVAVPLSSGIVLGADTVVISGGDILGKPETEAEASAMLRQLSGGVHQVITGVGIVEAGQPGKEKAFSETTSVAMRELSGEEISYYVKTGDPMDKAGAYAIQGFAAVFIRSIEGCYYNVVGLPLQAVYMHLQKMGIVPY